MNKLRASFVAFGVALVACSGERSSNLVADPQAQDPQIAVTLAKRIPEGDSLVMTVTNVSSHAVFLDRCGPEPKVFVEQFVNGAWTDPIQNFMCVQTPDETGPVQLAAGQTLSLSRELFEPGHFRFAMFVGGDANLSGSHIVASAGFDVP